MNLYIGKFETFLKISSGYWTEELIKVRVLNRPPHWSRGQRIYPLTMGSRVRSSTNLNEFAVEHGPPSLMDNWVAI